MTRSVRFVAVWLAVLGPAAGQEPAAGGPSKKPMYERLLTGADARRAAELDRQIPAREAADDYAAAIRLSEELLALRTRVQGGDHWEVADERNALDALRKVSALPAEKRREWRAADAGTTEARGLEAKRQFARALPLRQARRQRCDEALGEDHPFTARSYSDLAFNLMVQGRYAEAGPLFAKVLNVCQKALGDDHPATGTACNNVAYNLNAQGRYAEADPLYRKALAIRRRVRGEDDPITAQSCNNLAANLHAQAKFAEAGPLYEAALTTWRKALGDDHPDTAVGYTNLATNLKVQGRYADAQPLAQKALDIWRKALGEDHPHTARGYGNLAAILDEQAKFAEALPLHRRALEIQRKAQGEGHPDTARSYDSLAQCLYAQGGYTEARPLFQQALESRRKALGEGHPDTALSYNGLAQCLDAQGRHAEAEPLFQKALDIWRKALGEDDPRTGIGFNNLAVNLTAREKHADAEPLFRKALEVSRKALGEDHPITASRSTNLANNLFHQGQPGEAARVLRKALEAQRVTLGEGHPATARSYNNLATMLNAAGLHDQAAALHQRALDACRRALGENHPDTAQSSANVAATLAAQGKRGEARALLGRAVAAFEGSRLTGATGLDRAVLDAFNPRLLLAALQAPDDPAAAWESVELALARGLLDQQAGARGSALTPAEASEQTQARAQLAAVQPRIVALASKSSPSEAEGRELAGLLDRRRKIEEGLAALAARVSQREVAPLDVIRRALPADGALLLWVDVANQGGTIQEHWACVARPSGKPHWERLPGTGSGGAWSKDDAGLPGRLRDALAAGEEASRLVGQLRAQRLAPVEKHLAGVRKLVVIAAFEMAGVPVEVLTDRYTVSYVPSGTHLARLTERAPPAGVARLLVLGDPTFPPPPRTDVSAGLPRAGLLVVQLVPGGAAAQARLDPGDVLVSYAGEEVTSTDQLGRLVASKAGGGPVQIKVWREADGREVDREVAPGKLGVVLAREPARQVIAARRESDESLARLSRGEDVAELPGTQAEVARLAGLFGLDRATVLTRSDASKHRLEAIRAAGELVRYRYIHFATHGRADSKRAFESALLLARPGGPREPRAGGPDLDGRLTAAEVLGSWKLDAELVTLSACESGLGRAGGGDGLLGFAQAFLVAGSRSVCLTLWKVDDAATCLLMDRFYQNLLGRREVGAKPMGKAAALHEARQWLRDLPRDQAEARLGVLTDGVVRGEVKGRKVVGELPRSKGPEKDPRPYAHPRYWAAFILVGDPD